MLRSRAAAWLALLLLTVGATALLLRLQVPAALVLGALVSAITVSLLRPGLHLDGRLSLAAQAVLGCLIASALSPAWAAPLRAAWPALIGMNLLATGVIMGLGLLAARWNWLPGTAAIWGMSPGGASTMVMLSELNGADHRLVALLQYLRLLAAALTVMAVGMLFGQPVHAPVLALPGSARVPWLSLPPPGPLAAAAGLAMAGLALGHWLGRGACVLLFPVFAGLALQMGGWTRIAVPPLASAVAFTVVGWHLGLGFTRATLVEKARYLPHILACIALVLGACALLALLLSALMPMDYLTAFMALNPGGMDAVILMAAHIQVDLPFVIAMQIARLLTVMAIAPPLCRLVAKRYLASAPAAKASPP